MLEIIKNFTVNENKKDESREQQAIKIPNKGNDDFIVRELLQIDQLHNRLQKSKDQPYNLADTPGIYFNVNQDCYERNPNESDLNRNVHLKFFKCKCQGHHK